MTQTAHGTARHLESSGRCAGPPMRLALVAVVAASITMPSLSAAQEPPEAPATAFHQLPLLVNLGDRITVTDDTGRELQGELIDLSPSALSVLVDDKTACANGWRCIAHTRYDLQETDITGITQRHPDSLKDGALWGLMSGAALISVHMLNLGLGFEPLDLPVIGAYGGIGAAIGAIVDSTRVGWRVVYDTRGSSRRVSVAPLLSRDRTGVAVSLGF